MKKVFLLLVSISLFTTAFAQEKTKFIRKTIETKQVGDSVYYTKTTTTVVDDTTFFDGSCHKKSSGLFGLSFTGSFINNNDDLSNRLEMNKINGFNYGMVIQFGGRTNFGLEIVGDIGLEGYQNESNSKSLYSLSSFLSLNFGYPVVSVCKDKFMIVPRVGIGWNTNYLNYTQTTSKDIPLEEIGGYSWAVSQYYNFYAPFGLDFRFKIDKDTYFVVGGEYRYNFYYGNTYLSYSKQKVYDFPDFGLNNVSIKIGLFGAMQ
jgi:hypothetical protein